MKKVRISLAALTLVLAIAGTTMANKVQKKSDLCSEVDPKGTKCIGDQAFCCTDDASGKPVLYNPVN